MKYLIYATIANFLLFIPIIVGHQGIGDVDDDDLLYDISHLYDEQEDQLDPNDMLADRSQWNSHSSINTKPIQNLQDFTADDENKLDHALPDAISCSKCRSQYKEVNLKLADCEQNVAGITLDLQLEKKVVYNLQKKQLKEAGPDFHAFYLRMIQMLWTLLDIQGINEQMTSEDSYFIRHLIARISLNDIDILKEYIKDKSNIHKVDEVLQNVFELTSPPDDPTILSKILQSTQGLGSVVKNVEMWLYLMFTLFIILGVWMFYLFIRDIQREMNWSRVFFMMMLVLFVICCLWHWRHMHRIAETKRHANMMRRGFSDSIPEECKSGESYLKTSWFAWARTRFFGGEDSCQKYYEEIMIDPMEEITPSMVVAETLSKFFLQPLGHFGTESGKFIVNFYTVIPIVYHIPATILFLVMMVIILFVSFGYGIDFPFWLGGIRQMPAQQPPPSALTAEEITKQLNKDRELFLEQSRVMLNSITKAVLQTQVPQQNILQPLIVKSSDIMESQLEQLISQQYTKVLNSDSASTSREICSSQNSYTSCFSDDDEMDGKILAIKERNDKFTPKASTTMETDVAIYHPNNSDVIKSDSLSTPSKVGNLSSAQVVSLSGAQVASLSVHDNDKSFNIASLDNSLNCSYNEGRKAHYLNQIKNKKLNRSIDRSYTEDEFMMKVSNILEDSLTESVNGSINIKDESFNNDTSSSVRKRSVVNKNIKSYSKECNSVNNLTDEQADHVPCSPKGKAFLKNLNHLMKS